MRAIWVLVSLHGLQTLNLFKTKSVHFATPFKTRDFFLTLFKTVAHALFKEIFSFRMVNTIQNGMSVFSCKYSSSTKHLDHVVY